MHILITAATTREIQPASDYLKNANYKLHDNTFEVLISGAGLIPATYMLTKYNHSNHPDYILQAGIAGSFLNEYEPCTVVLVEEEIIGDWGAEENGAFRDIFDLQLADKDQLPFTDKKMINPYCKNWKKYKLPFVRSVTVNEITTSPKRIMQLKEIYNPAIESMEGAALHYICLQEQIPFMQVRAVSNFIGERDKAKWKMQEAIMALNESLINIIQQL